MPMRLDGKHVVLGVTGGIAAYKACEERSDNSIDRGVIGAIYKREAYFQNRLLFVMTVVNTLVSWSYYWVCFINIDINSADLFFFTWAPTTVYIISLIYLGGRYYTMWTFYSNNQEMRDFISRSGTPVRYIIINDDLDKAYELLRAVTIAEKQRSTRYAPVIPEK